MPIIRIQERAVHTLRKELVCVTGAGGFIGSWVVKELLQRGYRVRGTARDPADRKNAHLLALEGAKERLTLCRADILDRDSLHAALAGCHGVFHVAAPLSNDPNMYSCAKMTAEIMVMKEAAARGLQLAVLVPCMTMGPMLQQTLNMSIYHVARYLMGTKRSIPNAIAAYADVRDVARAHVLVYERPAARGRYLCLGAVLHRAELVAMIKELFPRYPVTDKCEDDGKPMAKAYRFSNQRLRDVGLEFTPLRKSLYETVVCLQQKGHVPVIKQKQRSRL